MPQPVILVLCEGLGDHAAQRHMSYMEGLVQARRAVRLTTTPAHPKELRPNYETLHTGVTPVVHGVTSDRTCRRSMRPNTFDLASEAGLSTAAVAHSRMSDLFVPPNPSHDSGSTRRATAVHHGCFFAEGSVSDGTLFSHAAYTVSRDNPHYALINPMGIDAAVHESDGSQCEYNRAVRGQDDILAELVPQWIGAGYAVIVTAGHGHWPELGNSVGDPHVAETPLYLAGARGTVSVGRSSIGSERVAPTIWSMLGVGGLHDTAPTLLRPFARC
jgi:predicted AlkP superfamily pyrophosphatase or phosphodiesterase